MEQQIDGSTIDRILAYYKGTEHHLGKEDDTIRNRIDYASDLLRQNNYDKALVIGMLVQKFVVSHQMAKNYIRMAEIIHAAFMEINIDYELLWLYEQLKKRIATAKADDKNYSKLVHAARELTADIAKRQEMESKRRPAGNVLIEIVHDPKLLDLPEDYSAEDELKKINELRRKAKKQLTGEAEEIAFEDVG